MSQKADIRELALDPSDQYYAAPLENDMFEWHFTIRGAEGTDFEGGIYHGRILLPPEYPYKPPHIMFLTPSGRFETNTKICLSFSAFHPELWQPAWGIRLILEALISFLPTPGDGAIGALDYTPEERRKLAKQSQSFVCPHCGPVAKLLPKLDPNAKKSAKSGGSNGAFSKEIAELQRLQRKREGGKKRNKGTTKSEKTEATTVVNTTIATTTTTATVTPTTTPAVGEAKSKAEARTAEGTESPKEVPELISPNANDEELTRLTIEEELTNENAASNDSNDVNSDTDACAESSNNNDGAGRDTAPLSEEGPQTPIAPVENIRGFDTEELINDLNRLYNPLLNISIVLMICICVLLCKKAMDLSRELNELRAIPIVDALMDKAASATSTIAASAASEEL